MRLASLGAGSDKSFANKAFQQYDSRGKQPNENYSR
jgi:hypothetical protein